MNSCLMSWCVGTRAGCPVENRCDNEVPGMDMFTPEKTDISFCILGISYHMHVSSGIYWDIGHSCIGHLM